MTSLEEKNEITNFFFPRWGYQNIQVLTVIAILNKNVNKNLNIKYIFALQATNSFFSIS